jgi:hypothetical protein
MLEIYAKCPNKAKLFAETFFKGGKCKLYKKTTILILSTVKK